MMRRARFAPRSAALLLTSLCASLLAACDGSPAGGDGEAVARVEVSAESPTVVQDETMRLTAVVESSSGGPLTDVPVKWYSADPRVAVVSHEGVVTGVAPGTTRITALVGGRSGGTEVTVLEVPIAEIDIQSGSFEIPLGGERGIEAVVSSTHRREWDRPVVWSVSDPSMITLTPTAPTFARLVGLKKGFVEVTASLGGKSSTKRFEVR